MNWLVIDSDEGLKKAIEESHHNPLGVVIFKHSTRCSISDLVKSRIVSSWNHDTDLPLYYLDLITYRSLSNSIAEQFNVQHESPQLLLIQKGKCTYHASHTSISVDSLNSVLVE